MKYTADEELEIGRSVDGKRCRAHSKGSDLDAAEFKISFKKPIKRIVRSGARVVRSGLHKAAKVSHSVTKTIDRVPVVGRPVSLIYGMTVSAQINLANSIARGARIDRAAIQHFRSQLGRIKQLAPYVQTVVTLVPGVGQGVGAAIGAGVALAEGRPLSSAVVEGIRGALPGGPAARLAFDLGHAALSGKRLDEGALIQAAGGVLPLSSTQRQLMLQGLNVVQDIAKGKRVDKAAFERAQQLLPPEARKALMVGVAVAQGQKLQGAIKKAVRPPTLTQLGRIGDRVVNKSPVLHAGRRLLHNSNQRLGFTIGAGLVAHRSGTAFDRRVIRTKLRPRQRLGFDLALSAYRGLTKKRLPAPPPTMNLRSRFGYYATLGIRSITKKRRLAVAAVIAHNPSSQRGAAALAIHQRQMDPVVRKIILPEETDLDCMFAMSNMWLAQQANRFFADLMEISTNDAIEIHW